MQISDVVLNLFEIGKRYKIAMYDEDGVFMEAECRVENKDCGALRLDLFKKNEEAVQEKIWAEWKDLDSFEEI
ncbi:hypothetical protein [Bacillus thuringiensis]|uniref:hypothetical protein n=1 Tax=Bacillus thuringiensis TaxID=1428 RepID=UPI000BFCA7FC|nr:hypothetical protein [Bacillus thuringiensis]PGT89815.1 hypothetical protein COD17_08690 [Bacillus thuringiensis]